MEKAQSKLPRDGGENRRGAPSALKLLMAPKKAQNNIPDPYRISTVIYYHERHTPGETHRHKSPQNTHKTTVPDLPHHTTVARTKPWVATTHAPPWPRAKRIFAAVRREGLAQAFGAFGQKPFAPVMAQKISKKRLP